MKNLIFLMILISGFAYGQFEITDSSSDWKTIGKVDAGEILQKNNIFKLRYIDYQSKLKSDDPLSTFKSPYQRNVDKLERAIEKSGSNIKSTPYEFEFTGDQTTLDKIFTIVDAHFANKTKEELTLTFPEGNLYLKFASSFGIYAFTLGTDSDNGKIFSQPMTKKQAAKLFGQK